MPSKSDKKINYHKNHRTRMRKRYVEHGMDAFSEHEIVEMLLYNVIARRNTNDIAHRLINEFGSLRSICDAPYEHLKKIEGVGEVSAVFLKMIPELARQYFVQANVKASYRMYTRKEVLEFFIPYFIGYKTECCALTFLDMKFNVIHTKHFGGGGVKSIFVEPRLVMTAATSLNASYAVLAHNHFASTVPSVTDLTMTRDVQERLLSLDILLLDHVIVCGNSAISLRASGHYQLPSKDDCELTRRVGNLFDY